MAKALFSIFVCEIEAILCSLVLFIMPFLLWRLLRLNFKAWYFVAISLSVPLLQGILYLFNGNHKNYALHVIYLIAIQDFYLWGLIHFVFHPLASYPGPFLWTISRLPQTYCLFRGTLPWKIHEIHKKYGPIVRLAPNELSYTTPEAWNDIYAKGEDKSQLRKDLGFTPSAATKVNGILFELDDNEHARLRRNLSHGFSASNIYAQEPIILKYTNQLIELLKSRDGEPVNMTEMFNFLTFDIAGDMVFGESFNCLTSATLHPWISFIFARVSSSTLIGAANKFWPFSFLFLAFIPKDLRNGDFKHAALVKEHLDKRLQKKEARPDFTTHLQKTLNKPNGLTYDDLIETTRILIVGGAETTATLLTGLIFYLLSPHHSFASPSPLTKLTTLLRHTFTSPSQITPSTLYSPSLLYLTACINEGLRLFPPLPGNLRRIVPPPGKVISGRWVPGGTLVAVDILAANLSRENFALPDSFCPERWLQEERKVGLFEGDRGEVVKPFSHGPRNCIGKNLALMEMQLILAHLFWHFDFVIEEESKDWLSRVRAIGFFVKPRLMARFSPAGSELEPEEDVKK